MSLISVFMGLLILMTGISDLKENQKASAYTLFLASGFIIFVAAYTFSF
ncbi:acetate permease [Bacillus thuringiensis]|nr:acetate permease [Bacillus thuringiensis]PGR88982.1 acetate permease [Bacillus thuringiensis]